VLHLKPGDLLGLKRCIEWHSYHEVDANCSLKCTSVMLKEHVALYISGPGVDSTKMDFRRLLCLLDGKIVLISESCLRLVFHSP